jgi:hypothetical protein
MTPPAEGTMAHDEESAHDDGSAGAPILILALGTVALLLLVCGGGFTLFWMVRDARMAAEEARAEAEVAREAHRAAEAEATLDARRGAEAAAKPVVPVARDRLVGARLASVAAPPDIQWTFTADHFTVSIHGGPAPELVFPSLVGAEKAAAPFEGRWQLSRDGTMLELSEVRIPGARRNVVVNLPISTAGPTQVALAGRLYDVVGGAGKAAPKKE